MTYASAQLGSMTRYELSGRHVGAIGGQGPTAQWPARTNRSFSGHREYDPNFPASDWTDLTEGVLVRADNGALISIDTNERQDVRPA